MDAALDASNRIRARGKPKALETKTILRKPDAYAKDENACSTPNQRAKKELQLKLRASLLVSAIIDHRNPGA